MSNKKPLVSIISLIYNNGKYFHEALQSVINQTYPQDRIEHFIIDDCSTDNSAQTVNELVKEINYECNFIRHKKNEGITKSLNEVLRKCNGKYFTWISDDIWFPKRLEILVNQLEQAKNDVALVCSNFIKINQNGLTDSLPYYQENFVLPKDPLSGLLIKNDPFEIPIICTPTVLVKTRVICDLGYYDEQLFCEDFDMWHRILRNYNIVYNKKALVYYRRSEHSVTNNNKYWTTIIKDIYQSLRKLENDPILTNYQKHVLLKRKFDVSKDIISSISVKNNMKMARICLYLYNQIKYNKLITYRYAYITQDLLDRFLIYVFKRNASVARIVFYRCGHVFRSKYKIYNIIFYTNTISTRLDYFSIIFIHKIYGI